MTINEATHIDEDWLKRQPWGDQFHIVSVELQDDLALAFWTAKSGDLVAGNAPLLIDTRTGYVHITGTGDTMRYYIENFRRSAKGVGPLFVDLGKERLAGHGRDLWTLGAA